MDVLIAAAVRTPVCRRNGALSEWHAVDLLAALLRNLTGDGGFHHKGLAGLTVGCATPVGEQALNLGRSAVLAAGWDDSVFAQTVDAQQVSSSVAIHDGVARISAGMAEAYVTGGVEAMSRVPAGAATGVAVGKPYGPALHERYAGRDGLVPPGLVAERLAERYGLSRYDMDAYAEESLRRWQADVPAKAEVVSLEMARGRSWISVTEDEHAVLESGRDRLRPLFQEDGRITAGNFAGAADGAACLLLITPNTVDNTGIQPVARIIATAEMGFDPLDGDSGFTVASRALEQAGLDLHQLQRIDVTEDTAATALAFAQDADLAPERLNLIGGSLATGQPLGAAGAIALTRLVHGLSGPGSIGLVVTAGTGGLATATIVERLAE